MSATRKGKKMAVKTKKKNSYEKTISRMELEAKRAQAQVVMLKMLYKELQEQKNKVKA